MIGNFDACYHETRGWEGGDVNHPKDPGGLTSRGVTQRRGVEYRRKKGLSPKLVTKWSETEVREFYDEEFWKPILGATLPLGVDLSVYDFGVNSGTSRSAKKLQAIVGVKADGAIGLKETVPAVLTYVAKNGAPELIKRHCASRLSFLQALNIWKTFGKGWGRRVAGVRAAALAMVLTPAQMEDEAKESDRAANNTATVGTGGAVAGGGGTVAVDATQLPEWLLWACAGFGVVVVVFAAIWVLTRLQQAEAIRSIAHEAKG